MFLSERPPDNLWYQFGIVPQMWPWFDCAVSTPEQARNMAGLSDGAIVGSAIVKLIARYGRDAAPHVAAYVKEMKDAVRLA